MSKKIAYTTAAAFALAFAYSLVATPQGHAGDGQNALSKCVDSVVAACNKKKSDDAIAACTDSGLSQCEKQHKAQIQLPTPPRNQATSFKTNGQQQPSRN